MRRILLAAIILFVITPFVVAQTNTEMEGYAVSELMKKEPNKSAEKIYKNGHIKILNVKRGNNGLMLTVKPLANKKGQSLQSGICVDYYGSKGENKGSDCKSIANIPIEQTAKLSFNLPDEFSSFKIRLSK